MSADNDQPRPRRRTLADQLTDQHDLLMALVSKTAARGSESMEWGERATGDKQGQLYLKSAVFVREDGEDWPAFIGRQFTQLDTARTQADEANADTFKRQARVLEGGKK